MNYACIFPGQGSQSVGMLSGLFGAFPAVDDTFAEASEILGRDLKKLALEGPAEELDLTVNTQPTLLTASVAMWRVWRSEAPASPAYLCGHSLGEYAALVCADALAFDAALPLVRRRAELMQTAVEGRDAGMAAVLGPDADAIEGMCAEIAAAREGRVLEAVNYNAPDQTVVAGDMEAIAALAGRLADDKKAKCVILPVGVPSHSSLMRVAAGRLATDLKAADIRAPSVPVLHNVDARPRENAEDIRDALSRQLAEPVRWTATMEALKGRGVETFAELGPGKVLAGLTRRIDRAMKCHVLHTPDDFAALCGKLREA